MHYSRIKTSCALDTVYTCRKMHANLPQRRAGKTLRLEVTGALARKGKSSGKPVSFKWTRDKTHTHTSGETRSRRVLRGFPSFWSNKCIWDIVNRETEMWRKLCVTKRWVTHQKVKTDTVEERERRLHDRQAGTSLCPHARAKGKDGRKEPENKEWTWTRPGNSQERRPVVELLDGS